MASCPSGTSLLFQLHLLQSYSHALYFSYTCYLPMSFAHTVPSAWNVLILDSPWFTHNSISKRKIHSKCHNQPTNELLNITYLFYENLYFEHTFCYFLYLAPFQVLNTWKEWVWIPMKAEETNFVLVVFQFIFLPCLSFHFQKKILLSKKEVANPEISSPWARKKAEPLQPTTRIPARSLHRFNSLNKNIFSYSNTPGFTFPVSSFLSTVHTPPSWLQWPRLNWVAQYIF